jgi:uncharacterized protein (TIGR03435 family)
MRRKLAVTVAVLIAATGAGLTQAPPPLAFDVASVKPNPAVSAPSAGLQIRPEQLEAIWYPVQALVIQAYDVSVARIVGLPDWTRTERYDVRAKTSRPSTRQDVLSMLRTLLADRFSLKVHREVREMDVYALAFARPDGGPGPKLRQVVVNCETNKLAAGSGPGLYPLDARPPCGNMISNARAVAGPTLVRSRFAAITMERLAATLGAGSVGRPVIDKTGLTGMFDVELDYLTESAGAPGAPTVTEPPEGVSLRDALKQQLGLELRPDRGPVEYLAIDSIARPTPD